jgi:chromosome segregation ATPase
MARMSCSVPVGYLILFMACSGGAVAQTQRSGGGGDAQKFMQQYQQLAAERTTLQADNARLKKELEAAKAEIAAAKKERDGAKMGAGAAAAQIAQARSSKESAERNLDQTKQRFTELVGRFRETAQNLKDVETDRGRQRAELAERNRAFDLCADANQQLFDINREVLDRYEHIGIFTRVSATEPFTRLTRTRIENLVDETRERAEQLRVKKRNADAAAPAGTPSGSDSPKAPVTPR